MRPKPIVLIPILFFSLSMIGARDCVWDAWSNQTSRPPPPYVPCVSPEILFNCNCTVYFGATTKYCKQPTIPRCATDGAQAFVRASPIATGMAQGYTGAKCNCTPDGAPPGSYPQSMGGDPAPFCSEIEMGAGGSPPASCGLGASGDPCTANADCASCICTGQPNEMFLCY